MTPEDVPKHQGTSSIGQLWLVDKVISPNPEVCRDMFPSYNRQEIPSVLDVWQPKEAKPGIGKAQAEVMANSDQTCI